MPDSCVKTSAPTMALARPMLRRAARGDQTATAPEAVRSTSVRPMRDMAERDGDFLQRRVAGALAKTEHGDGRMRRAAADRGQRVGGGETDIVVTMELDRQIGFLAHSTDRFIGRKRIEHARAYRRSGSAAPAAAAARAITSDVARIGADESSPPSATLSPFFAHSRRRAATRAAAPSNRVASFTRDLQPRHRRRNIHMRDIRPRAPRRRRLR